MYAYSFCPYNWPNLSYIDVSYSIDNKNLDRKLQIKDPGVELEIQQ